MKYMKVFIVCFGLVCGSVNMFAGDSLELAKSVEELHENGVDAHMMYSGPDGVIIRMELYGKMKLLPDWIRAEYLTNYSLIAPQPFYIFNRSTGPALSVDAIQKRDIDQKVIVLGPNLQAGQSFAGKKYLAITVKDIVAWNQKAASKP